MAADSLANVFCAHCHTVFKTEAGRPLCPCPSCGLNLTVTKQRSDHWQAYLGFFEGGSGDDKGLY
uniref:hypothetical protein n=1 Tax=Alteribacter lacisalsi TaxID=2045244 RepID=UPI0038B2B4E5